MKRAILKMTDGFLTGLLSGFKTTNDLKISITNGLPDDCKIIRSGYDETGVLNLIIESEEFEDIKTGVKYPILDQPLFHTERI